MAIFLTNITNNITNDIINNQKDKDYDYGYGDATGCGFWDENGGNDDFRFFYWGNGTENGAGNEDLSGHG